MCRHGRSQDDPNLEDYNVKSRVDGFVAAALAQVWDRGPDAAGSPGPERHGGTWWKEHQAGGVFPSWKGQLIDRLISRTFGVLLLAFLSYTPRSFFH